MDKTLFLDRSVVEMFFAIDIDQTICGSNAYEVYAQFQIQDLCLPIEPSVIEKLPSYRDFYRLPEVSSFYRTHKEEWNASRSRAILTPSVLRAFLPLEGAVEGVTFLSHHGTIAYYTARNKEVREVTQQWLKVFGFPSHENVVCCENIEQKLHLLASHDPYDEAIFLIDDRGQTHLLPLLEKLIKNAEQKETFQRIQIIPFGKTDTSFSLPCWKQVNLLVAQTLFLR